MKLLFMAVALLAAMFLHEVGHFAAALSRGRRLRFEFIWRKLWKIPIPAFRWKMPPLKEWEQRLIAQAGFGTEFIFVPIFYAAAPTIAIWYAIVAVLHFWLHPWYAGKANDFKWM